MGPASAAAINKVDSGSLMAELVSLWMRHYPRAVKADNASPHALESWMARAAQRGV